MRTLWTISFFCFLLLSTGELLAQKDPSEVWDMEKMNTAKHANYLSELEKEVIREMNMLRTNPKAYGEMFIRPRLGYYKGKMLQMPGGLLFKTQEGKKAAAECLSVLKKAKSAGVLLPSEGLSKAARDHAKDQGKTGKIGHTGSDRSDMKKRMERYGKWDITIGENIDYGNNEAREIIISLVIDDGVADRGHRTNLLEKSFGFVGVACGTHPEYRYMCVLDYAGRFTDSMKD